MSERTLLKTVCYNIYINFITNIINALISNVALNEKLKELSMAKKLTNFEIKLLIEYRMFQDIKNQADKKCKQLQKQVYELIQNKKLTEKENYIFNHDNNVFSVSEHTRTLTDMQQVRDFFVKKKVDMPVKQSTYYSIKNVTNNKEQIVNHNFKIINQN